MSKIPLPTAFQIVNAARKHLRRQPLPPQVRDFILQVMSEMDYHTWESRISQTELARRMCCSTRQIRNIYRGLKEQGIIITISGPRERHRMQVNLDHSIFQPEPLAEQVLRHLLWRKGGHEQQLPEASERVHLRKRAAVHLRKRAAAPKTSSLCEPDLPDTGETQPGRQLSEPEQRAGRVDSGVVQQVPTQRQESNSNNTYPGLDDFLAWCELLVQAEILSPSCEPRRLSVSFAKRIRRSYTPCSICMGVRWAA